MDKIECNICGNKLKCEELESPYHDDERNSICDECCHDNYEFTCVRCENYANIQYSGGIGSLFVAFDEDELNIPVGIYEVVNHPFYADGVIEVRLYTDAIKRVSEYTFEIKRGWYPMDFLCNECAVEIRNRIVLTKTAVANPATA